MCCIISIYSLLVSQSNTTKPFPSIFLIRDDRMIRVSKRINSENRGWIGHGMVPTLWRTFWWNGSTQLLMDSEPKELTGNSIATHRYERRLTIRRELCSFHCDFRLMSVSASLHAMPGSRESKCRKVEGDSPRLSCFLILEKYHTIITVNCAILLTRKQPCSTRSNSEPAPAVFTSSSFHTNQCHQTTAIKGIGFRDLDICEKVHTWLDANLCIKYSSNVTLSDASGLSEVWGTSAYLCFLCAGWSVDDMVHGKEPGIWNSFSWTTWLGRAACWELRSSISIVSIHSLDAWEPLQWFPAL